MGEALEKIKEVRGSVNRAKVGLVVDWDSRWSLWFTRNFHGEDKGYENTVMEFYRHLIALGVETDIISQNSDLGRYQLVVAPMMFLLEPGIGERIRRYIAAGGVMLTTYMSGYVNENMLAHLGGFPGDGLMEVLGLENEEIDTLWPDQHNHVIFNGRQYEASDYCEVIHTGTAEILGEYGEDWYAGTPAFTVNSFGSGRAFYLAARLEASGNLAVLESVLRCAGIPTEDLPAGVDHHPRYGQTRRYDFYLNETEQEVQLETFRGVSKWR